MLESQALEARPESDASLWLHRRAIVVATTQIRAHNNRVAWEAGQRLEVVAVEHCGRCNLVLCRREDWRLRGMAEHWVAATDLAPAPIAAPDSSGPVRS